ncbi:CaiB/BaiF CoA transferase family protein [Bosea sp. (in: a-proteobacteria)]|jgi:crotonobetainyl-CoA:carnitine CoA-transferase CaiB-like acyl-CoA transferase|uniref:CaiB/BaiF CoA transferase family protein n=1 Tax=Bosea sp. (in: a-proteobacteria) TaxID=1871050 RepID=UPI003F6EA3BE
MTAQPPLAGIKVVDYSHFLAGPYLSRCLAGMGAEVIKVERPTVGDAGRHHPYFVGDESGFFLQQNMGKKGICVDVKKPAGMAMIRKLVEDADVFVENYRPGALTRLGLGYEDLSRINPRLVYCSLSAYGHTGPKSAKAGFGLIAEAMSGAMAQLGVPGETPPLLRIPIADMYAGIHGVAAVCAALLGRASSGTGQHIDLALYDCMVSMHDYAIQCFTLSNGEVIPQQAGYDLPDSTVYGVFPAKDGHLVIAAQVDDAWKRLARLIGGEALADDQRFHTSAGRNAHRQEALGLIKAWTLAQPSVAASIAALEAIDVPCAPVQRIDEVLTDPQIEARGMVLEQDHPTLGKIRLPNLPFRFSGHSPSPMGIAPRLGEHNAEVARALGYSDDDIAALAEDGVLYQQPARI